MNSVVEKIKILKQKQVDALESNYLGGSVVIGRAFKERMVLYEKLSMVDNNIKARKMGEPIENITILKQNSYEYVDLKKQEVCLIDGKPWIFLNAFYDEYRLFFYVQNYPHHHWKERIEIQDYWYNRNPRRRRFKSKKYIWYTTEKYTRRIK
tara:strand:+ start:76 stop:531 length:456 start_codon:yes stop_codon:yes gene_type:complete